MENLENLEIDSLELAALRNNEHADFCNAVIDEIKACPAVKEKIDTEFDEFGQLHTDEDTALKEIAASLFTKQLAELDFNRDRIFRGMRKVVFGYLDFPTEKVSMAAGQLQVVFNDFGDIDTMPYSDETVAAANLYDVLTGAQAVNAALIHLTEWTVVFKTALDDFEALRGTRRDEGAEKSNINLKLTRKAMDGLYRKMMKKVNALVLVNGPTEYTAFINKLNIIISEYQQLIALCKGRNAAADNTPPVTPQ